MAKSDAPVISKLSDKAPEKFIPVGIEQFDVLIGGGFPRGRITEISGEAGVGKTYLVTKLIANLSKEYTVLFCDTEFSLNKDRVAALGGNPENIDYIADSRLEDVCEQITNKVGEYDVIILDSIAALVPMTIEEQAVGESANIGLYSRLIKQFVMKFRPRLGPSKTAFIAINQMRKALGMYSKVELPGGMSWAHSTDVRIRLTSNSADKILVKGVQTGHYAHIEVTKSKVSTPFVKSKFKVEY